MIGLFVGLALFSAIMIPLESRWPGVAGQRRMRRGFWLDMIYWVLTTVVTRPVTSVAVAIVLWPIAQATGAGSVRRLMDGFGPLSWQPRLDQLVQMIVLADFVGYWVHRAFHHPRLWRFHAIHHSSEDLDWLSAVRLHPVNDLVAKVAQAVAIVALGYSASLLAAIVPLLVAYAILLHANVTWDFGWCKKIFASPKFHRWHHTSADEGQDKNFAGILPIWDYLFGTYYMPAHQPARFGVSDSVPADLFGQLIWPFRRSERTRFT